MSLRNRGTRACFGSCTRSGARKRRTARQKLNGLKVARRLYLYASAPSSPARERVPGFNDTGLRVSFGCALAGINWQPKCETAAVTRVSTRHRGGSSLVSHCSVHCSKDEIHIVSSAPACVLGTSAGQEDDRRGGRRAAAGRTRERKKKQKRETNK